MALDWVGVTKTEGFVVDVAATDSETGAGDVEDLVLARVMAWAPDLRMKCPTDRARSIRVCAVGACFTRGVVVETGSSAA